MITAAVLCPHPPLLLRELGGLHDPAPALRQACRSTLREALASGPDRVLVVGTADVAKSWDPALSAEVRSFGPPGTAEPPGLPLSLGVGARLLREAGWRGPVELASLAADATAGEVESAAVELAGGPGRTLLLVLGDGSARRGERAPGFLDDRAFGYDAAIGQALGAGDAGALRGLDRELGAQLMVLGLPAFWFLGAVAEAQHGVGEGRLSYADDPFGVMYFVASWRLEQGPR